MREIRYVLGDGTPATGWTRAPRGRRAAGWALDVALFAVTLGVGWTVWSCRLADRATTPGKALLGLTVFATDTRRPATRQRMLLRGLVFAPLAVAIGAATLGLGWLYLVAGLAGRNGRPIYDEWARVVVLHRPTP